MIHDSGSFLIEYLYSENPVMFVNDNIESLLGESNDFGKMAYNLHYKGKSREDIINFIDNIVIKGNDPLKEGRLIMKQQYLIPPNGKSVAENTMDDLIMSLSKETL